MLCSFMENGNAVDLQQRRHEESLDDQSQAFVWTAAAHSTAAVVVPVIKETIMNLPRIIQI